MEGLCVLEECITPIPIRKNSLPFHGGNHFTGPFQQAQKQINRSKREMLAGYNDSIGQNILNILIPRPEYTLIEI